MKVLRKVLTDTAINEIKNVYQNEGTNSLIANKHGSYIDKRIKYSEIFYCSLDNQPLINTIKNFITQMILKIYIPYTGLSMM